MAAMMMATLRTALLLAMPACIVLLCGMPAMLRTGQIDPLSWAMPALILFPATAALRLFRGAVHAAWAGTGALLCVLLFARLASGRVPDGGSVLWLSLLGMAAMAAGICIGRWKVAAILLAFAALGGAWLAQREAIEAGAAAKPRLVVVSALPLFWGEEQRGMDARADAPIITLLRRRFDVQGVDSFAAGDLAKADALLLAQPRPLPGQDLMLVDQWVRSGGRAVVLADPMLRWPSALPIGDRRRAPAISLLSPLLARWGVRLLPPSGPDEQRRFLRDGTLLTSLAASGFATAGSACRIEQDALVAWCRVGEGAVTLLADADLIDDRLWLADPAAPADPRQWTADTPAFLNAQLGGEALARPRAWLRSEAALLSAVRWTVLFGIIWAIMGSVNSRRILAFVERNLASFSQRKGKSFQ